MDNMDIIAFVNRNYTKPLDVQIEEMKEYLSTYIIEASDTVYLETNNALFTVAYHVFGTVPITLTMKLSGSVRIYYTLKDSRFFIDVNGVNIAYTYNDTSTVTTYSKDIEVAEGDVITFRLYGYSSTTSYNYLAASSLNICGDLIPYMQTNLIEVTEV